MKRCSKCKNEKPYDHFYKKLGSLASQCKTCAKAYIEENKDIIKQKRDLNKESFNEKQREKYLLEKEARKQRVYRDREKRRIKLGIPKRNYVRLSEKEKFNILLEKKYKLERNKVLMVYKKTVLNPISTRSRIVFHNTFTKKIVSRDLKTLGYICCSIEQLKTHIQRQFTKGMSLDNYGLWQIDHIYPLSKCESHIELIENMHYTNLQPLWKADNFKKHTNVILHSKIDIKNYF